MRLNLAKPTRREGTASLQFIKRVPQDLKAALVGRTLIIPVGSETVSIGITESTQSIRFSLKTADVREAKARQAEALAYVDQYLEAVRTGRPIDLSHRQITALAGEFYVAWARGPETTLNVDMGVRAVSPLAEDEEQELLEGVSGLLIARTSEAAPEALQAAYSPLVDRLLARHGVPEITRESRERLVLAFAKQLPQAVATSARYAGGDYSPDANLQKFPAWEEPAALPSAISGPSVSLTGLVEDWWREASAAGGAVATYEVYSARFKHLAKFLEHDDARRVTPQDLVRFKDHRLASINPRTGKPLSAQTIRTGEVVAFRSVFGWAVENGLLPVNPALGLKVKAAKRTKLRERDFTDEEALAILRGANAVVLTRKSIQFDYLKRWAPWLCAYSGARVGEIVQLRKEDFRKSGGHWVMTITPEAGTVKTKELREVPLHAHLIELGFMDFVRKAKDGYLFLTVQEGKTLRHTWRGRKSRLAEWVRNFVPDPNVAPNHGWRHTFKAKGFEVDIQEKVLDAICGHTPQSQGRKYGSVTLKTKVDALAKFPRWDV